MISVKKGARKRCYGLCRSDTHNKSYSESLHFFFNFPKPCLEYRRKLIKTTRQKHIKNCPKCAKCDLWVKRCGRGDGRFEVIDHVNKDTYICSLHSEGENGPTTEHPDPINCVTKEQRTKVKVVRTSSADKYKQVNYEKNQDIRSLNRPVENMDYTETHDGLLCEQQNEEIAFSSDQNFTPTAAKLNLCDEENDTSRYPVTGENCKILTSAVTHTEDDMLPYVTCDQSVQTDIKKFTSKRTQVSLRQSSAMDKFEESISNDAKKCKFYTSLEYCEIVIHHNFVNPECKSVTDVLDQQKKSNNSHKKLTSIQQLILVLIRLRVGTLV